MPFNIPDTNSSLIEITLRLTSLTGLEKQISFLVQNIKLESEDFVYNDFLLKLNQNNIDPTKRMCFNGVIPLNILPPECRISNFWLKLNMHVTFLNL